MRSIRRAPQRIRQADQRFRPASAVGGQRHPRHVEDGDRQFRDHAGAVRAGAGDRQLLRPAGAEGARAGVELTMRLRRRSAGDRRRPARVQPDPAQPAFQRDQVHRPRRPRHGQRGMRSRRSSCVAVEDTGVGIGEDDLPRLGEAVLPGARVLRPPPRRHRPRPVDRARAWCGCTAASIDIRSRLGEGTRVTRAPAARLRGQACRGIADLDQASDHNGRELRPHRQVRKRA